MRRRIPTALLALVLLMLTSPASPVSAAELTDEIAVAIEPAASAVVLGESLDLHVSVTNTGPETTPTVVVHIDITNPDQTTSVDPEDWTPTLSKTIGQVAPGETVVVDWTIQPISAGRFAAYAVALSPGVDSIAASNVLHVHVADQRSLDPGGILPFAIAAPTLIGVLLIVQMRYVRRDRHSYDPAQSGTAT